MRNLLRAGCALAILAVGPAPGVVHPPARIVEITARRFQFAPREIALHRGETVTLRLHSEDVTHGFFSRPLGIDTDVPPGRVTDVTITPAAPGRFPVICDHFCGSGHAGMNMTVVVE